MKTTIVTPWHNESQRDLFTSAWGINSSDNRFVLQQDTDKSGGARTKNVGIRKAIDSGADCVIVLDDDCFPNEEAPTVDALIEAHVKALDPQPVAMFAEVTSPPSRGTPYFNRTIEMPVAASLGFWTDIGDYDAASQLVYGARHPMTFRREAIHGQYFPLCGMNLAFRAEWWPWCQFVVDVGRMDDIWQGFLWQKKAYATGHCFNLNGPLVRHSRQSNVWQNLKDEANNLERNETIWQDIHRDPSFEYEELVRHTLSDGRDRACVALRIR